MKGLEGLFNEIAALQKGNLAGGDGASRGLLDGRDLEAVEKGTYNEATMNVLRMYLNEVERRRQVEQREGLFTREITSRNIPLPADQREAVVKAFIAFQDEALELIRGREEGGLRNARELAQADFEAHRERFHAKVREMVGNEVAEKLFTIRTMQTAGFFHGPDDDARNKDPRKDGR